MHIFVQWRRWLVLAAILALSVTASERPVAAQDARLNAIASFSILGDIVQNVGGDRVRVRTLVGPNGDMHSYQPTPADARALAEADVFFQIGQGFETRIEELYRASRSRAAKVTVTDGQSLIRAAPGDSHRHGEYDPHVWHDLHHGMAITYAVRDALIQADPGGRDTYTLNAAVYAGYLNELDAWIVAEVGRLPVERRKLVTAHLSMTYFARRYGFEVLGAAISSLSTEGGASARDIAALAQRVRAAGVPAIFGENLGNNRLIETVAAEARVDWYSLYTDALGPPGSRGGTYYDFMYTNAFNIVWALSR
jgi:zinc/manganese transport system substrate-binding protein